MILSSSLLPLQVQPTSPSVWSKLGLNYGNDIIASGIYSASQVLSDLSYLRSLGFTSLRLAMPQHTATTTIGYMQSVAQTAKQLGFYTIWGVTNAGTITSANWAAQKTAILAQASASAAWGTLDEYMLGNEFELGHDGSITAATIDIDLSTTMATTAKGYAGWKVSYGFDSSSLPGWISQGRGSLDYVSLHQYGTFANFQSQISQLLSTFGQNCHISEWGDQFDFVTGGYTETQWAADFAQRIGYLKSTAIRLAYIYTYRSPDNWNLVKNDGTFHQAWQSILAGV